MPAANPPPRTADEPIDPRARDAELMARVAAGADAAFATLHGEHYAAVFRLALSTVLDREEARDVTQEVFVRLHRIAPRWESRATVRTWLYRTTVNVALSMGRRLERWLRPREMSAGQAIDAEDRVLAEEAVDQIRDALSILSPRQRAVVSLHFDAGMTAPIIADELGITANAARVTLHKGIARLRGALNLPPRTETHPLESTP